MKKFDTINVVPFIDVLLVLLAIVLTTSTFVAYGGLAVSLPSASATTAPEPSHHTITLAKDGTLEFDRTLLSEDALGARLAMLDKTATFTLFCDKDTPFAAFVKVMDMLKSHSFETVTIATQHE